MIQTRLYLNSEKIKGHSLKILIPLIIGKKLLLNSLSYLSHIPMIFINTFTYSKNIQKTILKPNKDVLISKQLFNCKYIQAKSSMVFFTMVFDIKENGSLKSL